MRDLIGLPGWGQIDRELKFDQQVEMVANKLQSQQNARPYKKIIYTPGWTNREQTIQYTSLVRPILEYGNVAWAQTLERDQQMIENIQRRIMKLVPELKNLEYCDILRPPKLPSLYYRRARGDMIETYKYLHGIYKVDKIECCLSWTTVQ